MVLVAALSVVLVLVLSDRAAGRQPEGRPRVGGSPNGTPTPTPAQESGSDRVTVCATHLCVNGSPWYMNGASVYNPGLRPEQSGFLNPTGTVALAERAGLDTIRIVNFFSDDGIPSSTPYAETTWAQVDQMIADAGGAGLHVDLDLSDYRNILWNSCINPYTSDWTAFIRFVATRRNTVTGRLYADDPTIAVLGISGEPLPVGSHMFVAPATGQDCTVAYTTQDLTDFYARTTGLWKRSGASVIVNPGGLGYLNEPTSGIDWKAIFALPTVDLCDIKTYGGMLAYARTVATYCESIGKPWIDEEFGWQQSDGDAQRATEFRDECRTVFAEGSSGANFWNLGYQIAPTSYDISPATPATLAAARRVPPVGCPTRRQMLTALKMAVASRLVLCDVTAIPASSVPDRPLSGTDDPATGVQVTPSGDVDAENVVPVRVMLR